MSEEEKKKTVRELFKLLNGYTISESMSILTGCVSGALCPLVQLGKLSAEDAKIVLQMHNDNIIKMIDLANDYKDSNPGFGLNQ